jgi:lipoprotein-releasing system permease protein
MIGVSVIIIVMSVMNGFRDELTNRLLGINGHITIYSSNDEITSIDVKKIKNINNNSINFFPMIETQALIVSRENSKGVFIRSYESNILNNKKLVSENIVKGRIYNDKSNEILIGHALAEKLNLDVLSKVKIAIPKTDKTIFGNIPRFKTLIVSGIFDVGMYEYDFNFIFTNLDISRKLLLLDRGSFTHIEIESAHPSNVQQSQKIINKYLSTINPNLYSVTWMQNNASLLNALKVEKNVMFLILVLIILVASMNIISGLIIFVKEKNKDIGILKTIGLNQFSLLKIFTTIGLFIGIIGTIFGVLIGILFSQNIQSIQKFIENVFQIDLFSDEIYYLSSLPSRLDYVEVLLVIVVSLIISLISTLLPAYRASKIDPIKTIKNE